VFALEVTRGSFLISTDPNRLDASAIHSYLSRCYWAEAIPLEIVERSLAGSLCFGLYEGDSQLGLARVITDRATYAYLCDVYVLDAYQGRGLGCWLMETVMGHPDLQGLRRFSLVTRDAMASTRPWASPRWPNRNGTWRSRDRGCIGPPVTGSRTAAS
jgi:ribosomal protein S18 acetylase RimI-like enzyme